MTHFVIPCEASALFENISFWLELRKNTWLDDGNIGRNFCEGWAYQARAMLRPFHQDLFVPYKYEGLELASYGLGGHIWLCAHQNQRVFIADGTAGQIDAHYSLGFYNFLENAPIALQSIYSKGRPCTIVSGYKDG